MTSSAYALTFSLCLILTGSCQAQAPSDTPLHNTDRSSEASPPEFNQAEALDERLAALADVEPSDETALPVMLDGEAMPHPVWQATLMPGETLTLEAERGFSLAVNGDAPTPIETTQRFTAPETPGVHELTVFDLEGRLARVSVFVLKPLNGQTVVEGYRIGSYPSNTPEGLIRVTQETLDTPVSPSFMLGQFLCKQQPGHWPKFVLVSPSLLNRLEALLDELKTDNLTRADSFFVMSGFRTPFYNTAIGSARLSRHMYGDAADIYPDVEGGDGVMDDLNGDGRVTRADANFLYDFADRLYRGRSDLDAGGIGAYGANAVHGPFVHVDGRGSRARWGRGES